MYICTSAYKNLLSLIRSTSLNFTLLSDDVCTFLFFILHQKKSITFRPHYDADMSRASHQHLGLN